MIRVFVTALLFAAAALCSRNPKIVTPKNSTYSAGDEILIQWSDATTGFVNIDLVNDFSEVLTAPVVVALGVPASQKSYSWKVPPYLKTAVGYRVRVWGSSAPQAGESLGSSSLFTIFNNIPQAINAFKVLSPSGEEPCVFGKPCTIKWDLPDTINGPAFVHINLFEAGNPNVLQEIAHVPTAQKSFVWNVPADGSLLNKKLYVSVSGAGTPPAGPGFSNEMGANGQSFAVLSESPAVAGQGSAAAAADGQFNEQAVLDTETVTVTTTTGTTTIFSTVTDNGAAAIRAATSASYAVLVVIPLLALLF